MPVHGLLRAADASIHWSLDLVGEPLPLWAYRVCCATEKVHDWRYPGGCPCCERFN